MPRFIEVDDPQAVSVGAVAQAARKANATHVVVTFEQGPPGIVPVAGLDVGDQSPIADRVDRRLRPTYVELATDAAPHRTQVFHGPKLAVVFSGDQPLMLESEQPFDIAQIDQALEANRFMAFAADTTLPGKVDPPPDPIVVYTCENDHTVPQRQSNSNRDCPFCPGTLEL